MTFSSDLSRTAPSRSWSGAFWENTLSPRFLDELFANAAELQYTRTLLFSSVVDLMGLVVNRIQPAVNSAYHARAKTIGVSLKSVYNKLDNLETGISAAMVGTTAERLETVVTTMGGALPTVAGLSHQDS